MVRYSVFGRRINVTDSLIEQSILFDQLTVEPGCVLQKVIVDVDPRYEIYRRAVIPTGTKIGVDRELDLSRGFTITESGVTVVPSTWFEKNSFFIDVL